jgi:DNA repair protein RadC
MSPSRPVAYAGRVDLNGAAPHAVLRRRLVAGAASTCSDVELLGVLLDGGVGGPPARLVAEEVLRRSGGLPRLGRDPAPFAALLGPRWRRRLAMVRAAMELGRRAACTPLVLGEPMRDAAAVYAHFRGRLPQWERERFFLLLLDGRNRLMAELCISEGTLTAALVHPREVFAPAIRLSAAAIVVVHNHPSGDPTPSAEDAALTERLRRAGDVIGIRLLDHVVIGQGRFVSMSETGRW